MKSFVIVVRLFVKRLIKTSSILDLCNLHNWRMDFKQKYIVKCVSSLLALPEEPAELINSEKLAEFTGSKAINVLLVLFVPGKSNPRTMFRNGQSVFSTG